MTILTNSFLLASNSSLLTGFSGYFDVENKSDFSDNPQDFTIYIGSLAVGRTLKSKVNPGTDPIIFRIVDTLPIWVAATAHSVGVFRQPTASNTYRYKVTTAGTTHATTEPTWPTSPIGATVTDGTVVWTLMGKKHAVTEYKLALSSIGLDSAIGGASLSLGVSIPSGVPDAIPIYVRVTNAVATPGDDVLYPDVGLSFDGIKEF